MVISHTLGNLPAGLYHIQPDSPDLIARLAHAIESQGCTCLVFPAEVADYLVAETVRHEAAFDLENQGLTGDPLAAAVDRILWKSIFWDHIDQMPMTLSGGEKQLLALTAAMEQPHDFFIGQHCFDFVSSGNHQRIKNHLETTGKRMLDITYRNGWLSGNQAEWRMVGKYLEAVPIAKLAMPEVGWRVRITPWHLVVNEFCKDFADSNFSLRIPHLTMEGIHCLGIFGDNGTGKSTFADCLAGLTGFSGSIGIEIPDVSSPRFGYLVQQITTPTHGLQVGDIIQRFVSQERLTDSQAEQLVNFLGTEPYDSRLAALDARIGYRLVIIAAMLAGDYDLLILDEPTYGLPPTVVARFLVRAIECFGVKPLVFISHDSNFISLFCDRAICLANGAVSEATFRSNRHR